MNIKSTEQTDSTKANDKPRPWQHVIDNFKEELKYPSRWFKNFMSQFENLPRINFEQAEIYSDNGRYRDAITRLKILLWLFPKYYQAWHLLGKCYLAVNNKEKSIVALGRAVQLTPNNEELLFLISNVNPALLPAGKKVTEIPRTILLDHFEAAAEFYEATQKDLKYTGHIHINSMVRKYSDKSRNNYQVLDLGCGTGLVGFLLEDIASEIDGVDISQQMIEKAAAKKRKNKDQLYDKTFLEDMRIFLPEHNESKYYFILSADTFSYVGDIETIIQHSARILKPEGYFIFQAENYKNDFGIIVGEGRFGHSIPYVEQLIKKSGLKLISSDVVGIYPSLNVNQYVACKE